MYKAWKPEANLRKLLCSEVLRLLLVDVLHQNTLVLEHIALNLQIQSVVPGREGGNVGTLNVGQLNSEHTVRVCCDIRETSGTYCHKLVTHSY